MNICIITNSKSIDKVKKIESHIKGTSKEDKTFILSKKIDIHTVNEIKADIIISKHYPYLVPDEILKYVNDYAINFHPSLLPLNKGYFPILWATLKDTPYGISIHQMDNEIDGGRIYVQKKIAVSKNMTLEEIYDLHQKKFDESFCAFWPKYRKFVIDKNEYTDFVFQENKESTTYYKKESLIEVEKLRDKWNTAAKNARKDWLARQFNKN